MNKFNPGKKEEPKERRTVGYHGERTVGYHGEGAFEEGREGGRRLRRGKGAEGGSISKWDGGKEICRARAIPRKS